MKHVELPLCLRDAKEINLQLPHSEVWRKEKKRVVKQWWAWRTVGGIGSPTRESYNKSWPELYLSKQHCSAFPWRGLLLRIGALKTLNLLETKLSAFSFVWANSIFVRWACRLPAVSWHNKTLVCACVSALCCHFWSSHLMLLLIEYSVIWDSYPFPHTTGWHLNGSFV